MHLLVEWFQEYQAQTSKEMWRRRKLAVNQLLVDAENEDMALPTFRKPVFLQGRWGELSKKQQNKRKHNYICN